MSTLAWYFPRSMEEATLLVREPGIVPHGGGTGLLRTGVDRLNGLIDLRYLPVFDLRHENGVIEIGAGLTFAEVVRQLLTVNPESVLVQSLSRAAATPLRNRITMGGSVAMAPVWSDLLGPLVALEADVVLSGKREGVFAVTEYVSDRQLRTGTLVKAVRVKDEPWESYYFRATATHFDYASFTITALARANAGILEDLRLVVVGAKQKFVRLLDLEARLTGQDIAAVDVSGICRETGVEFSAKTIGGPEYVKHVFSVELERAVKAIAGCTHSA